MKPAEGPYVSHRLQKGSGHIQRLCMSQKYCVTSGSPGSGTFCASPAWNILAHPRRLSVARSDFPREGCGWLHEEHLVATSVSRDWASSRQPPSLPSLCVLSAFWVWLSALQCLFTPFSDGLLLQVPLSAAAQSAATLSPGLSVTCLLFLAFHLLRFSPLSIVFI